jgi:hypothetical protein
MKGSSRTAKDTAHTNIKFMEISLMREHLVRSTGHGIIASMPGAQ